MSQLIDSSPCVTGRSLDEKRLLACVGYKEIPLVLWPVAALSVRSLPSATPSRNSTRSLSAVQRMGVVKASGTSTGWDCNPLRFCSRFSSLRTCPLEVSRSGVAELLKLTTGSLISTGVRHGSFSLKVRFLPVFCLYYFFAPLEVVFVALSADHLLFVDSHLWVSY